MIIYIVCKCEYCLQIGFNAGMIIDDGMTMVSRAARINPQYKGKGLYRILDNNLTDWAKSRHVTIKSQATTDLTTVVAKPSFQKKNQLIVSRVCIFSYLYNIISSVNSARRRVCVCATQFYIIWNGNS